MTRVALAAVIGLCALAAAAAPARAEKRRVVVLAFDGTSADKAEETVEKIVARKHTLVSAGEWAKSVKRMKVKKLTATSIAKVAADVQVDAVVSGTVNHKGGKWTLVLTVKEGKSGRTLDTLTIPLRNPRVDVRAAQDIDDQLTPVLAQAEPIGGGDDATAGGDDDAKPAKGKKGKTAKGDKAGKKKKGAPAEDEPVEHRAIDEPAPGVDDAGASERKDKDVASSGDGGGEGDGGSAVKKKSHDDDDGGTAGDLTMDDLRVREPGADLSAGVSFIGRKLGFTFASTLAMKPFGYDGNPVPGIFVDGEVYPLALGAKRSALSGVGVSFVLDRVFTLKSKLASGGADFTTTQTRYGIGLMYRIAIGKSPTGPTVKLGLAWEHLDFTIDTQGMTIDLPNVAYSYVRLGGSGRIPLGSPTLALYATAGYLAVLSSGDISLAANYGSGSVAGFDVDGGLEYRPKSRWTVRAGGRYERIAYAFDGSGAKTQRDATPGQDVGGALDQYFGGYVTAGYLF